MFIARVRSPLRLGFVLAAWLAGCSPPASTGAMEVRVNFGAGLLSRCVKVTATDGDSRRETMPIALSGKTSPLRVGVVPDGLSASTTVQALGYSDEGCTMLASGEFSETATGKFGSPPTVIILTLRANTPSMDGGSDAGIDKDLDTYPLPADCDDSNPAINPGTAEVCDNGIDDDCDSRADCQQAGCNTFQCGASSNDVCMGGVCVSNTEINCNDGVDNDGDNLVDCLDPECPEGTACTDGNSCTMNERCVAGGGCEKTSDRVCTTPPAAQCYEAVGTCMPDAGATCSYAAVSGPCDDGLSCTENDVCASGSCTAGTTRGCNAPPGVCFASTGTCVEPSGTCAYAPLPMGSTCNDGLNCTLNDTCMGDGGCAGTPVTCTPSQCQTSNGCSSTGACLFDPRTNQSCNAGTGPNTGVCDVNADCNVRLFPTSPSNFTESQLPSDGSVGLTVSSDRTLDTDGPTISQGTMPPYQVIMQGSISTLLVRLNALSVNSGKILTITGSRPVIFAVVGDVVIAGRIRGLNGFGLTGCGNGADGGNLGDGNGWGGGGGGAFGTTGGRGGHAGGLGGGASPGPNGDSTLIPLRGGCNGGNGTENGSGGNGGGAIQITASRSLTVAGAIGAPGQGGAGAPSDQGKSGGGGGSGGAILLEAATLVVGSSAYVTANGASGGEGSGGSSGRDGIEGNEFSGNATPNGGSNSPNGGNGGVGAGLSTAAGAGLSGASNDDGSGGGGGGVGRIYFKASTSCSIATSGLVVSPAAVTSCP